MNIHRKGKSGCEISINRYKNVFKNASIPITEELPGNYYKNGSMDHKILEYRLHREDYWLKTLRTITAQKLKFVTFTEEILNGKLHFWCSVFIHMV